jgi:hypothetical protein
MAHCSESAASTHSSIAIMASRRPTLRITKDSRSSFDNIEKYFRMVERQ